MEAESVDGSVTFIATVEGPDGVEYTDTKTIEVSIAGDGSGAQVGGDFQGLYARLAFVLEYNGESGLFITQVKISDDGSITIPRFFVPGVTVKGINIALVGSLSDVATSEPAVIASDSVFF